MAPTRSKTSKNRLPKTELRSGASVTLSFPGLPPIFYKRDIGKRLMARMTFRLPDNYDPSRKFPLFIYIQGNWGSDGNAVSDRVRSIMGDKDFILATLPLFKTHYDPTEYFQGKLITSFDEYPLISRCYKKMLGRLFEVVPNVDYSQSSMGGFSNGANTTALLLSAVDPFILKHFRNFFLIEGGGFLTGLHKKVFETCSLLILLGGKKDAWQKRGRFFWGRMKVQSKNTKRDVKLVKMKGAAHEFPDAYYPTVRKWVVAANRKRIGNPFRAPQ